MLDPKGVDVVILCAGRGARLRPLTDVTPKAMVPLNGVPLIDYHLRALHEAGVQHGVCVVGHLAEQVERHVRSGEKYGLRVEYALQAIPRGTGDAVLTAASSIHSDPFGVVYADTFFAWLGPLWREVLSDAEPKMVCARVADAGAFGRVIVRGDTPTRWLERVVEKDGKPTPGLVNSGMYLLPRRLLSILRSQAPSPRGENELPQAVESLANEGVSVRLVETPGWIDAGSPESLGQAEELARKSIDQ
jgi:NDP-sugar pyrophosphorylase family protein